MKKYGIDYFLGANTPVGFVSFFDELNSPEEKQRCFIIKGGPGTGKSTLMKSIADELERNGFEVHRVHCSSDPDSLDAVRCEGLKLNIADGTSPHVIEPAFPGAVENIINLGEAWDDSKLSAQRDEIISLTRSNSACHSRSVRFLKTAGLLISDSRRLAESSVYEEKISLYVNRFIKRNCKPTGHCGHETRVFLSAVTPENVVFFSSTVNRLAQQIIEIDDSIGLASSMLTESLRVAALRSGLDVIAGYCPLDPTGRPEHIIIPSCSVAFIRRHDRYGETPSTRAIHARRFTDSERLAAHRQKLAFNRKASDEMISEAAAALSQAKKIHDELERIYISAMDFDKLDLIKKQTLNRILK